MGGITARALARVPGLEILHGGRRATTAIDLRDPNTFGVLDDVDVVVNCTDTFRVSPEPLYRACAVRPLTLFETTAQVAPYVGLPALLDALGAEVVGRIVPGAGVFPGWSNLVVAEHVRRHGADAPRTLALSWSVLSGAGAGTCEVMARALHTPRPVMDGGELHTRAPLGVVARTGLPGTPWGLELGLPEAVTLPRSLGIPRCTVLAAVRPALPAVALRATAALARLGVFGLPGLARVLTWGFRALRGVALRGATTRLDLHVSGGGAPLAFGFGDAFAASGAMLAASVALLAERPTEPAGLSPIETVLSLAEVWERASDLGFDLGAQP